MEAATATPYNVGICYEKACLRHCCASDQDVGAVGPKVIWKKMKEIGLHAAFKRIAATPPSKEEVLECHSREYLALIDATEGSVPPGDKPNPRCAYHWIMEGKLDSTDSKGDNRPIDGVAVLACEHSRKAAYHAAGATLALTKSVMAGEIKHGFGMCNPGGHHAAKTRSGGYCIFNNTAIAARAAINQGLERVCIVDFDVHHGDGTQNIFYDDPAILTISIHRYDGGLYYPASGHLEDTGSGKGLGKNINIPWGLDSERAGSGRAMTDGDYLAAFQYVIIPAIEEFKPQMIFVYSGFDPADGDPVGKMKVSPAGFGQMTACLMAVAHKVCDGKLVMELGGGYSQSCFLDSAIATLRVLSGEAPPPLPERYVAPAARALKDIRAVVVQHSSMWQCFNSSGPVFSSLLRAEMDLAASSKAKTEAAPAQKPIEEKLAEASRKYLEEREAAVAEQRACALGDISPKYKTVYSFAFAAVAGDPATRKIDMDLALQLWEMLLLDMLPASSGSMETNRAVFPAADKFVRFIRGKVEKEKKRDGSGSDAKAKPKAIVLLDTWNEALLFLAAMDADLSAYNAEESSWPVLLDEFAEEASML